MEFSPALSCTRGLVTWSPNGNLVAHAVKARLFIRDSASLKVLNSFYCLDTITGICWSPKSDFVAASLQPLGITHVFNPANPEWTAKITEGPVGLSRISFAPDGRHLLSLSDLNLKLTIWSLVKKNVKYIKHPKCFDFCEDGTHLAVVEKSENGIKDSVGIYDTETWQEVRRLKTDMLDTCGVSWCPQETEKLVVWDWNLSYCFQVFQLSGSDPLITSRAEEDAPVLGIKTVTWSPCGQILAVGDFTSSVKLFNCLNFKLICELKHKALISRETLQTRNCVIYEEKIKASKDIDRKVIEELFHQTNTQLECVTQRPVKLSQKLSDVKSAKPKIGISHLKFTHSSHGESCFLATRDSSMPNAVWIWDIINLELHSLIMLLDPVTSLEWEPGHDRLVIATAGNSVYFWTCLGAVIVKLPINHEETLAEFPEGDKIQNMSLFDSDLQPDRVSWNPQGKSMIMIGKDGFLASKIIKRNISIDS